MTTTEGDSMTHQVRTERTAPNESLMMDAPLIFGSTLLESAGRGADWSAEIGGKAGGLLRLGAAGLRVPDWAVIPAAVFHSHIQRCMDSVPSGGVGESDEIVDSDLHAALSTVPLDPHLVAVLEEYTAGRGPVAVRSSVVGEDGAQHSFAGIFETSLHVEGADQVAEAVRRCWASAYSARAVDYWRRATGAPTSVSVAVVVQELVVGEASGVLFTADPVTGRADRVVTSSCWGLGEGVVSGECNTDEFTTDRTGALVHERIADKDRRVTSASGGGVRSATVPEADRRRRSLTPEVLAELVQCAVMMDEALGGPQDVEWTVVDGSPVFLQARTVTASAVRSKIGERVAVWDNSNIQESFNGVTLPLTFSWAVAVYESIFRETLRLMGVPERVISENNEVLRNMVGLIGGRVYYNIGHWYSVIRLLPFFRRNKEDIEKMLGVTTPVDLLEDIDRSPAEILAAIPRLAPVAAVLGVRMARRAALVDKFQMEVGGLVDDLARRARASDDLDELLTLAETSESLFARWSVQILNDLYLGNQSGRARRLLAGSGSDTHEAEEVVAGLLASEEAVESIQPTLILMRLAARLRGNDDLVRTLNTGSPREGYEALRSVDPVSRDVLDDFVDRFGDRCMGEQKLETISLREDPTFIAMILRNNLADSGLDPAGFETAHRRRREQLETELLSGLDTKRRKAVESALRRARTAVRDRERMRLTRTRIVGAGRSAYLRIGGILASAGSIGEPRDVFYLTKDEIRDYVEGRAVSTDLFGVVRARKAEYAKFETVEPPNQIRTVGPPSLSYLDSWESGEEMSQGRSRDQCPDEDGVWIGTGCWPGLVEGEAIVVHSPNDDLNVVGRIMVARRTDPGWGPLFPSLKGLLVERGSLLSHSAVLARELGIPTVVGVAGLLESVHSGDQLQLNGGNGRVVRLSADEE